MRLNKSLFLPAIAIAEMAQGIGKLRRAGGAERADCLDRWLDDLLLLTCNPKHFGPLGVVCADPLIALPLE